MQLQSLGFLTHFGCCFSYHTSSCNSKEIMPETYDIWTFSPCGSQGEIPVYKKGPEDCHHNNDIGWSHNEPWAFSFCPFENPWWEHKGKMAVCGEVVDSVIYWLVSLGFFLVISWEKQQWSIYSLGLMYLTLYCDLPYTGFPFS